MTSHLHQQVRRTIRRHALCPPGSTVIVGLSGGSDSVALTFLMRELAPLMDFALAGVVHVNHQLRETASRDEALCRAFADRLGLAIRTLSADVRQVAATQRLSVEDAARRVRYELLERAASDLGATRIAVGHTLDDQAETFLLKLARGAGATGLGAIYPARGAVIRPLLDVTRSELRRYLTSRGETWTEDESNADVGNPRNCVRHDVLPYLEDRLRLPVKHAMARAAGLIGEDARWLDQVAADERERLSVEVDGRLELDADALRAAPTPIARRVLLHALRSRANGREVGLEHVQTAVDVLTGLATAGEVPGSRMELRGKKLVLVSTPGGAADVPPSEDP